MSRQNTVGLKLTRTLPTRWLAWSAGLMATLVLAGSLYLLGPFAMIAVIGGMAGLLALLRAPWLGVLILVASVPAQEFGALQAGGQSLTLTRAAFPLAVAGYIIAVLIKREPLASSRLTLPYVGFVGVVVASLAWAGSMTAAGAEIGRWLTAFVSFLILLHFLLRASQRRLILFVAVMALGGVFEATFGVTQSFLALGPASFRVGDAGSRAFGTFGQPNSYAGYLEMVLFPVAWMGIFLVGRLPHAFRRYREARMAGLARSRPERVTLTVDALVALLFCLSIVVILGGILASYSRGAWLGVAAGGLVTTLVYHRRARIAVFLLAPAGLLVLLGGLTSVVPQSVTERITTGFADVRPFDASRITITDDNFAAAERMAHWQAGWHMFTDQPLTGVGAGNFNEQYPEYYVREQFSDSRGHAHNYYIHVLAETGLAGLASYLVLIGSVAALALTVLLNAPQGFERMLTLGGFGTIVSTGIHNVFENLQVLNLSVQLGLVWVLVIVGHRRWRASQDSHGSKPAMERNS